MRRQAWTTYAPQAKCSADLVQCARKMLRLVQHLAKAAWLALQRDPGRQVGRVQAPRDCRHGLPPLHVELLRSESKLTVLYDIQGHSITSHRQNQWQCLSLQSCILRTQYTPTCYAYDRRGAAREGQDPACMLDPKLQSNTAILTRKFKKQWQTYQSVRRCALRTLPTSPANRRTLVRAASSEWPMAFSRDVFSSVPYTSLQALRNSHTSFVPAHSRALPWSGRE